MIAAVLGPSEAWRRVMDAIRRAHAKHKPVVLPASVNPEQVYRAKLRLEILKREADLLMMPPAPARRQTPQVE